jgi:hypothetical protein
MSTALQLTPLPTQAVSGTVNATPNRPSQGTGRTYTRAALAAQAATATALTVTPGSVFYCTSLVLTAINADAAAIGQLEVRDNLTALVPIVIPQAGLGALGAQQPAVGIVITFQEPLQFATSVVFAVVAGTLTYSCAVVGYEQ